MQLPDFMLILAIDTAGREGSIALLRGGELVELVPLAGRTYSAQLMPQIAALLARHKLEKRAIDAYAAATGPGSFTGLRVGLSTIKALAEITHQPIAAVSLLEALAWAGAGGVAQLSEPGTVKQDFESPVIAALDAMRGEAFVGEYVVRENAVPKLVREVLLPLQGFAAEAQLALRLPVITPDESVASLLRAHGQEVQVVSRPQSDVIARIGALKIAAGQVVLPETLDANYIRRSDAEIFSQGSS